MNRASAAIRVGCLGLTCALLWSAAGTAVAMAQTAAPPEAPATLNAVDFNFVGQANLGAPFQIDSGRLAETKGTNKPIVITADNGGFVLTYNVQYHGGERYPHLVRSTAQPDLLSDTLRPLTSRGPGR